MRRIVAAVLLSTLVACSGSTNAGLSGGGAQTFVPGARSATTPDRRHRKRVHAYAQIIVPREHHHRHRRPKYISPSTKGIQIVADYNGSGTFVQTTVDALGPNAPDCQTTSSGFLCIVTATVWEGSNTITVTTYDTAPSNGKIPPSAQILGTAKIDTTVTAGKTPYISIFLGGEIGSINAKPAFSTAPADGASHDVAIVVNPKDFGNHKITAGTNDPFANPIDVTLSESGGNNHAVLLLNGKGTGSNATIKFSGDTLGVRYDGGGKPGYSISVQLAANGAPSEMLQVSPLIVDGPGIAANALGLNGAAVSNGLTITEANAPASQTYNVTRAGCAGIATTSGFSGSGASAAFTATGGTTGSAGGCTISIIDGNSTTLALPVTNTPIAGGVAINGVRITEYGVGASPGPMTVGPDNNLYVVGNFNGGGNELIPFKPNAGSPTMGTAIPVGPQLYGVVTGSDGALWVLDYGITGIDRVTTGG
ncbi:MAG TPA: hypothetical protein VFE36_15690, partial [Candidatus Baltobacteraceae bacterium]|nr:hypothetical protein [Candidatus Baltobacteraceae bacterium]